MAIRCCGCASIPLRFRRGAPRMAQRPAGRGASCSSPRRFSTDTAIKTDRRRPATPPCSLCAWRLPRAFSRRSAAGYAFSDRRANLPEFKRDAVMVEQANWVDIGSADEFSKTPLKHVTAGKRELAVSCKDGKFGAVSNACNHVGGPLGEGRLDGDYIVCPWHNWKFHRCSGLGESGFEDDRVPAFPVREAAGRVFINIGAGSKRTNL